MLPTTGDAAVEFAKLEYQKLSTEILESERDVRIVERLGLAAYFYVYVEVLFDKGKDLGHVQAYAWWVPAVIALIVIVKILSSGIRIKSMGSYIKLIEVEFYKTSSAGWENYIRYKKQYMSVIYAIALLSLYIVLFIVAIYMAASRA